MATLSANRNKSNARVPIHILDELSSKFLINLPEAEKNDLIRLFFQIELAHWFFLDFYCTQEQNSIFVCGIKQFALSIFEHIPFLNHHVPSLNTLLDEWRAYKLSVPTYGAILLTPDMKNCLLVQSFFAKNSWSFPKGKVNENEDPVKCAVREVYEETGFDCGHLIDENAFIEGQTSNYQYTRLYVVKNVPVDTKFCPRTRNEIKDCSWFTVDELPNTRNDDGYFKDQRKIRANSFYMILPFISKLKHWITNERLAKVIGNNKKKQKQLKGHSKHITANHNGNSNNCNHKNTKNQVFTNNASANHKAQKSNSPYFANNNIASASNNMHNGSNHANQLRNARARHKSTGDVLETFFSPTAGKNSTNTNSNNTTTTTTTNGTFYNDHLKLQNNNTSTPIMNNGPQLIMPSSSSAFRATNNISNSFKKKLHLQKSGGGGSNTNGKVNGISIANNNGNLSYTPNHAQLEHTKRRLFSETKENQRPLAAVKPFAFDIPESWRNFKFDHQKIFNCM